MPMIFHMSEATRPSRTTLSSEALEDRERLLVLLKAHSLLKHENADFTLASGRSSSYYIDAKMCSFRVDGFRLIGSVIFDILKDTTVEAVGGLAIGAIPMALAAADVSDQRGRPILAFAVRETPKKHGTRKHIEGLLPVAPGSAIAIVDDVITTGGSVRKAIAEVEAQGCIVQKVIVLVDRHEGGSDSLRADGYDVTAIFSSTPGGELLIEPLRDS